VVSREGPWRIGSLAWALMLGAGGRRRRRATILRACAARSPRRLAARRVELVKFSDRNPESDEAERQALNAVFTPSPNAFH